MLRSSTAQLLRVLAIRAWLGGIGLHIPNLKFWDGISGYSNFNHSYFLNIVEGGASGSTAVVLNSTKDYTGIRDLTVSRNFIASTSISTPTLTCDTISKAGTQTMNATTLNLNPTTLQIRGTTLSATATELNALSGCMATATELNYLDLSFSPGTAEGSKALVLDSNNSITSGLASFTGYNLISTGNTQCRNADGTIYGAASPTSDFNLIINQRSNTTGTQVAIAFCCDGASNLGILTPSALIYATRTAGPSQYGTANLSFSTRSGSAALSPLVERMRIHQNGYISFGSTIGDMDWNFLKSASSTTLRYGSDLTAKNFISLTWYYYAAGSDSNGLQFNIYGTSNAMFIGANDRVGIGTQSPGYKLHVVGGVATSMAGPLASAMSSVYAVNQASTGSITDTVGCYVEQALRVGSRGVYVGSDRRVKQNIADIPNDDGYEFVRNISPKIYNLLDGNKRQTGYISQDLVEMYSCMLQFIPDESMKIEQDGDIDGCFLNLDYMRIIPMLHAALRRAFDQIEILEKKISGRV